MKIAIVATSGESLVNFRGKLIEAWVGLGHEVTCVSIETREEMEAPIRALGAAYEQVAGERTGIGPGSALRMIRDYGRVFQRLRPDLCFLYMSKPIAFGGVAAIQCGIRRIVIFQTGLEIAFYSGGLRNAFVRFVLKALYRAVQRRAETVLFMCHTDLEKMVRWGLVRREQTAYVDGSGVDMTYFARKPLPEAPVVCMTARLVWSKGIREYIGAARIVRRKRPDVRFLLCGGLDSNDEALTKDELDAVVCDGTIEYCGHQKDVRPYLEQCSIFALPSYHEGKGKSILEAQAVGRPIVTTTAPGCSETVEDGYNGFLVPPKDEKALAEKIMTLVEHPELRASMAENAYTYCQKTFDVNIVNRAILKRMGMIECP